MDEGVNTLLTQLCDLQLGTHQAPTVAQPKLSRQQKRKKLWNKSWNVLFTCLNGPHRKQVAVGSRQTSPLGEVEQLYALAYDMRKLRNFDAANDLEETVERICKDGIDGTLRNVLRLLINLADVQQKKQAAIVGHEPLNLPIVFPKNSASKVLPKWPLCHRDTRIQRKDDPYYTHFPSELFEVPGISMDELGETKYDILDPKVFETEPGSGLCGNGVFNVKFNMEDGYEKNVQLSLFGALTFSKTMTMDIKLDLPDIHDTWNTHILDLKPAKIYELSEDEGFVDRTPSSAESLASSCTTPLDGSALEDEDERDIWDLAMEHKPSRHHTWEHRGQPPRIHEKPYLTESGPEVFNHLYHAHRRQLQLLDPDVKLTTVRTVSMARLVKDTINMLIGVPSATFNIHRRSFSIAEGTHVMGMSPEGVASALEDLLTCGSQYVRLVEFSRPPRIDSHYHAGLVFQAFSGGVRKYLQHYRACVLSIPRTKTLLQLSVLLDRVRDQMRILSSLCQCDNKPPLDGSADGSNFPMGVKLLSYLYDKTFEGSASLHYPMLLSLLHTSCGPYIMFVRDWVFEGHCQDVYGEFLIQINEDYLRFRDRHYWTHGYMLVAENLEDSVPLFLKDLANDIFVCGKSINLLRLIAPDHFLFAIEGETPSVSITFSEEVLRSIEQQCRTYLSRMQEVSRQHTMAREDLIRQAEKAKQDILVKARQTAMEQISKFQERAEAIKKAQDKKKRAAFAELKAQMEKDLRRRAAEKEQEKEEDAARIAANTRQELLEAAVEEELAQKAREELIEEYAKMTAEVAHREQRALWRVARHRLETRRIEFLANDEGKWQTELLANPFVLEVDENVFEDAEKLVSDDASELDEDDYSESEGASSPDIDEGAAPEEISPTLDAHPDLSPSENDPQGQDIDKAHDSEITNTTDGAIKHVSNETGQIDGRPSVKMNSEMHASKESDPQLPRWAQEGGKSAMAPFGLEEVDKDKMPNWARKVLEEGEDGERSMDKNGTEGIDESDAVGEGKTEAEGKEVDSGEKKRFKMVTWAASRAKKSLSQDDTLFYKPHVSHQSPTVEQLTAPSVKMNQGMSASKESQAELDVIPHKKSVSKQHVSKQSTPEGKKRKGMRKSKSMSATMESVQETDPISKKKFVGGKHVSQLSVEPVKKMLIKIDKEKHPSHQSEPGKMKVFQRNMYGHPSQMSMASNYELIIPTVKIPRQLSPFDESDFGCFLVRPRHKKTGDETDRPGVAMNRDRYSTKESEYIDYDKIRLEKFKAMNVHGHSSDSTVQRLLYGEHFGRGRISRVASLQEQHEDYDIEPWTDIPLEEHNKDFSVFNDIPVVDLMTNMGAGAAFTSWGDYAMSERSDVTAYSYISLAALMKRSVMAPLAAQVQLVNQSLVNYFNGELEIDQQYIALRRFLLMQDGEFGQCLSDQLFEKLATNPMPHEMLNPMYLNNVLSRALRSSIHGDTAYAGLVSFALKYIPTVLNHHAPNALDCLELTYKVDWPVNVVITENALTKYCRVFSFMLQLKRAVWVLKDVWYRLKRDSIINKASTSAQFRRLQLFRHEMQHFVKVMQGYIANQVIHVTWQEFQEDLSRNVHSLDDLHRCHTDYLSKCVFRCLLNKKAGPVMKIIEEIFSLILKFRTQLISHEWHYDEQEGVTHPAYDNMCNAYKVFKDYARFLFKVVSKLALRGYQPHLQELLLRLNFNSYYNEQ